MDEPTLYEDIESFLAEASWAIDLGQPTWLRNCIQQGTDLVNMIDATHPASGDDLREKVAMAIDRMADKLTVLENRDDGSDDHA